MREKMAPQVGLEPACKQQPKDLTEHGQHS
jgi:hypothetical protein